MDTASAIRVKFSEPVARTRVSMEVARQAAIVSLAGVCTFAALVLLLHVIKPELEPSWRFVSEYSIGRYGWVMVTAFFAWGLSCLALFVSLREEVKTLGGRIGRRVLFAVGLAMFAAGLFDQDPVTAKPDELSTPGTMHGIAAMIGIPGLPLAAVLIGRSVTRHNRDWIGRRRLVMLTAYLTCLSLVAMAVYLAVAVPRAGGFRPGVHAGWMNRLVVFTYCVWQIAVSYGALVVNSAPAGRR
jgi:Protein of unknown function (DUF998)